MAAPANSNPFLRIIKDPFRSRLFLLLKLPSAYFSGLRIREADERSCHVAVPYKWFSRNPFRSTYFACLSMAAEMSTGVLAMTHLYKRNPPVSMLVVGMEGNFHKKATQTTVFRCDEGDAIARCIEAALQTGEGRTIRVRSAGYSNNELIAEFYFTWSFKARTSKH